MAEISTARLTKGDKPKWSKKIPFSSAWLEDRKERKLLLQQTTYPLRAQPAKQSSTFSSRLSSISRSSAPAPNEPLTHYDNKRSVAAPLTSHFETLTTPTQTLVASSECSEPIIKGGADAAAITPLIASGMSQIQNRPRPAAAQTPTLQNRPPPPPKVTKNTISNSAVRRTCGLCLGYRDFEPGSNEMCVC
ncbi:hypothetical protein V492_01961 [Pseudogymnoascus sp. VKM F-4246]|nr:hypothetical protein V492_01961 [Pseudogymnoascus sp. VKM F-4246]